MPGNQAAQQLSVATATKALKTAFYRLLVFSFKSIYHSQTVTGK